MPDDKPESEVPPPRPRHRFLGFASPRDLNATGEGAPAERAAPAPAPAAVPKKRPPIWNGQRWVQR